MSESSRPSTPADGMSPDLAARLGIGRDGGAPRARVWFRALADGFWGTLLAPSWFHTWIELVERDDRPPLDLPLSLGVYDKRVGGRRRAILMHQGWEHEEEQRRRYRPGYLLLELPGLRVEDLREFHLAAREDRRRDLGPYAFLRPLANLFGSEPAVNCMSWVESFVRRSGGAPDVLGRLALAFRRHELRRES